MAGVKAGVVGEAEVNSQPENNNTKTKYMLSQPATWSYIWVGLAFVYLIGTYFGMIRLRNLGS